MKHRDGDIPPVDALGAKCGEQPERKGSSQTAVEIGPAGSAASGPPADAPAARGLHKTPPSDHQVRTAPANARFLDQHIYSISLLYSCSLWLRRTCRT